MDSSNTESVGKKNKRGWAAQTLLTSYDRPGNVRQLENAIVHALVRRADVVVHNLRVGAAERLGIDYATLGALNPRLIYCHTTGYGARGPRACRRCRRG